MDITLTLILEPHELHWIEKVREAYKLAGAPNPDYELEYNPFEEIFSNQFLIDDVFAAKDMLYEVCEKQITHQSGSYTEFSRAIITRCQKAKELYGLFYEFCLAQTGELTEEDT